MERQDRLKCKTLIKTLFDRGDTRKSGCIKVVFMKVTNGTTNKVGVSVSKRHFKRAVDRNRIKRLMREAYRLRKNTLREGNHFTMMFLYQSGRRHDYTYVYDNISKLLEHIQVV